MADPKADARPVAITPALAAALARLVWPLRLTHMGMAAERAVRAFWPLWTILLLAAALMGFGLQDQVSVEVAWFGLMLLAALLLSALYLGVRQFRWPTRVEALARLDLALPGRPIAALMDHQAIGAGDAASVAVWQAHKRRMAARAAEARAVEPDLKLSSRDRYGLRYLGLTLFVAAVLFGSIWRVAAVADIAKGGAGTELASGPSWEGWVEPPAYTGKPSLYLNDIKEGSLTVPKGSRITLRLYGEVGNLTLAETVSGRTGDLAAGDMAPASAAAQDFTVAQSGTLAINGAGGREWAVTVAPDAPPAIALSGPVSHEADGRMVQPFAASDDYGVVKGRAEIVLDLASVDRRFGLAADPEPRDTLVLDLPMPISGNRAEFSEKLIDDLSQHAFANLPVTMTLHAEDAAGQTGASSPVQLVLPGRRFFDPMAATVIEMRRDLMWSRGNAVRTAQILRAVTNRPEEMTTNERAYLQLRVALKRLEAATPLEPAVRDELVVALWDIAVLLEEGDLADAKARLDRAQDRLSEAIKNGANEQEIAKLMQDLNEAMQDYMQQLAEQQAQDPDQQTADGQNSMQITQDQMQQMLDKLQQLMAEGRTAEAQELLNQLRNMMENMQVTQGQGGQPSPGQKSMQGLADTLQDQQGLSDDAFRDLQRQFNQGQPGDQPQPGQDGQSGQGEGRKGTAGQGDQQLGQGNGGVPGQLPEGPPEGPPGSSGSQGQPGSEMSLADRQQALQNQLDAQRRNLPAEGTPEGDAARDALDRAGRAMAQAEQALRDADIPGAIDRQADAMEALRDGMRNLGKALAQNLQQPGQADEQQFGQAGEQGQRDPLGRELGGTGAAGTPDNMLQGEDVYRRAREILDEIRRRSGEQARPDSERGYLRRLLDQF